MWWSVAKRRALAGGSLRDADETRTTLTAAKASGGTFDAPRVPILSPPVNRGKEESAGKRRTTRGGRKPGRELGRAQLMTAMECDGKVGRGGREGSSKRQSRRQTVAHGNRKRSSKWEGITAELRSLLGASQRGHRGKWETCNGALPLNSNGLSHESTPQKVTQLVLT